LFLHLYVPATSVSARPFPPQHRQTSRRISIRLLRPEHRHHQYRSPILHRFFPQHLAIDRPYHVIIMDCFSDFCLRCDKQTNGPPFCSQLCKLANVEPAPPPRPASAPKYTPFYFESQVVRSRSGKPPPIPAEFRLPPAFNFSAYHHHRTHPLTRQTRSPTDANAAVTGSAAQQQPSSQSSSSSTSSTPQTTNLKCRSRLSAQAEKELQDYAGSFDQIRTAARRKSET
jgi:hypothetical protein